jgi:hypothetical protein
LRSATPSPRPTYDTAAIDNAPADPSFGSYASVGNPYGFSISVDGSTFAVDGVTVNTQNNNGFFDFYGVIAIGNGLTLQLSFEDDSQNALSSDALPTSAPTLSAYTVTTFSVVADDDSAQFDGIVTQIACTSGCATGGGGGTGDGSTVPEPQIHTTVR